MIDIFEPVVMTEALITNFPPFMFLTNTFFSERKLHSTKFVDFDIQKGKRRMAPFVSRLVEGKLVERTNFKTQRFEPPYIKPKMVTTSDELLKRLPGESTYVQDGSNAPAARAAKILGEDITELQFIINRRIEWMSSKALFTGIVPVVGEGVNYEIDLLYTAAQLKTLLTTARWDQLATADPEGDLTDWKRQIKQLTGKMARTAILGRNAATSVEDNTKLKAKLDNRRTEAGLLKYEGLPEGAEYIGFLAKPGMELFTYDEWYAPDAAPSTEVEMVPENMCLVGSQQARARRHYGAISDVEAGNFEVETFVKSWVVKDPSARFVMAQSAVLTAIEEPECFVAVVVQDAE